MPMTRKHFGSGWEGGFSFSFSFLWCCRPARVDRLNPSIQSCWRDGTRMGGQQPGRQTPYRALPSLAISQRAGARRSLEWEAVMFCYCCWRILGTFVLVSLTYSAALPAALSWESLIFAAAVPLSCFDDVLSLSLSLSDAGSQASCNMIEPMLDAYLCVVADVGWLFCMHLIITGMPKNGKVRM